MGGGNAFKEQAVDDPEPVKTQLGNMDEDTNFLDQNSYDSNSVQTQSSPEGHDVPSDLNVPIDHHVTSNANVPSDHSVPIDHNTHSDHNFLPDNSRLDPNSFDLSLNPEISSFHNLLMHNELLDQLSQSNGNPADDNFLCDYNSPDRNGFDGQFTFDDELLDQYNLSI